jgi:thioredoxin 1
VQLLTADSFEAEVVKSEQPVVVDVWGPRCRPCLALMPAVEALAQEYEGKIKFGKLNVIENRQLVISLCVMGLPTFVFYKGGEEKDRISGDEVTAEAIRAGVERLLSE